jgi:hypothetical protein
MRGRLALCALLTTTAAGAGVLTPAAQARRAAPAPHVLAPATSTVRETVCGLLKYPLKTAARKLIGLIAEKDIAVLSASLLTPVATEWCKRSAALRPIFNEAVRQRASIRTRIGPFAFNLHATARYVNGRYDLITPWWSDFTLTRGRQFYALWYRLDGGRWRPMTRSLYVVHGHVVQFAVRITDSAGRRSPWAYSPRYRYR